MQIGSGKQGVRLGEYGDLHEDTNPILGWIEPACDRPNWIGYFTAHGDLLLYTEREETGAVVGDPIRVKARPSPPAAR